MSGASWRVAETAAKLIAEGAVPQFVVVSRSSKTLKNSGAQFKECACEGLLCHGESQTPSLEPAQ